MTNPNPQAYPPLDLSLFEWANNWVMHDGSGCPVDPLRYVKVMYSNGFISNYIRVAHAWQHWTGGRDWWIKPDPADRLYIMMYVVIV